MSEANMYLQTILQRYAARDLSTHATPLAQLKNVLTAWAGNCFVNILDSGSHAKGTAISLSSDVDYLVSLTPGCAEDCGGLRFIYDNLFTKLNGILKNVRRQNVSVRITLDGLEVDITPGRRQSGNSNCHSLYVSKLATWKQTNIQIHINDVSSSGRINEIKLLKIWRALHNLDFPSIYLEYMLIQNILLYKPKGLDNLADNFLHVLDELSKDNANPLFSRIVDPASTSNVLSELLSDAEKNKIKAQAKSSRGQNSWGGIVWK